MNLNRRSFVIGAAALAGATVAAPVFASADAPEGVQLQIFAANSLQKALPEVQALYTEQHPEVTFLDTQFKASGDLVEQMIAGAEVDLLITASKGTMDKAEENNLIDAATRETMFVNDLVIVVAEGSDIEIGAIEDVVAMDSIAIGDSATVPAGKYANQTLASVGLYTDESGDGGEYAEDIAGKVNICDKVGTCASYVSTGDCQVGFVYSSDVYRYDGIEIAYVCPEDSHKEISYPGAVCATSANAEVAADFMDFCMTDPAVLEIWSAWGFELAAPAEEAPADEAPADGAAGLADGSYTGTGTGIGGKFDVTVTVEGGQITAVEVGENSETQGIGSKAIEELPAKIVEAQGIDGVDGVSGATVTSKAIFKAVTAALEEAQA